MKVLKMKNKIQFFGGKKRKKKGKRSLRSKSVFRVRIKVSLK